MMKTYTDKELLYSATARCRCGAGMAYPLNPEDAMKMAAWVCSDLLKGIAGEGDHTQAAWCLYKVREETSINNRGGATTRPAGTVCLTVGHAECKACGHKWASEPYSACGLSHHWFPMKCPKCGNDCGANGSWSSDDKRPRVETRFSDVVLEQKPAEKGL